MFEVSGCTNPVSIHFEGCRFEFDDGLHFGSFDPVTGLAISPTLPYYNQDSAAHTGRVFQITNSEDVILTGAVTIDGRDSTRIIGGKWGDKGTQCIEYGIQLYGNKRQTIDGDFYIHHLCLDGVYIGGKIGNDCRTKVDGLVSLYNARQGLSIVGGSNIVVNNSTMGLTGFGVMTNTPGAGVDIEPELYPIRGLTFPNR